MRFLWSFVGIGLGTAIIIYSFSLTNFFGHMPWAEEHIGGGGTNTLYKVVGVLIIILSFLYMFGNVGFITGPLGPLFGGK